MKDKMMKNPIKIAVAQFEPESGNKRQNLMTMESLVRQAADEDCAVISFHELCTTGYTFLKDLSKEQVDEMAEEIPEGDTVSQLIEMSNKYNITLLAGVLERDSGAYYNSYVAVNKDGYLARHRKLHPFISKYLSAGSTFTVFDLHGWKAGILICYDNNVIENVRATTLKGAEVLFAPHVTGCTPSSMPGRGYVSDALWQNREIDPVPLRQEFDGPKHREWLMRWLPARAYDNGIYYAFSNPIGYDGEHLKGGNAMILDPYGDLLSETKAFGPSLTTALLTPDKLTLAGGYRYRNARRPELYRDLFSAENDATTVPYWMDKTESE